MKCHRSSPTPPNPTSQDKWSLKMSDVHQYHCVCVFPCDARTYVLAEVHYYTHTDVTVSGTGTVSRNAKSLSEISMDGTNHALQSP